MVYGLSNTLHKINDTIMQPIEEILNRKTPLNDLDPTCNLQMA